MRGLLTGLASVALPVACLTCPSQADEAAEQAVRAALVRWMTDFNAGNTAELAR